MILHDVLFRDTEQRVDADGDVHCTKKYFMSFMLQRYIVINIECILHKYIFNFKT